MNFTLLPALIYVLCMTASATCGFLLTRTYARTRSRLLLWTAVSFIMLAANNFLLVLDMLVFRQIDLWPLRSLTLLVAILVLLYGFIWEADR